MKKNYSKIILLLLCFVYAATTFAGCITNVPAPSSQKSESAASSDDKTPASAEPTAPAKISDKERVLKVVFGEHPNQPVKNFAPAQQEIFRKTNIKLEFEVVPSSNYNDKKKILLATNTLPDVIAIGKQDINDFASTGIFLPLMNYVNNSMPNFKEKWEAIPDLKSQLFDGEMYGFPVISRNEAKNGFGPVIREDLLKKHNIAAPKTFDELLTVLEKLKELYPDSVPWSMRSGTIKNLPKVAYFLGSGYDIYYDKDVDGGRFVFGPATQEFKEVLAYLNRAYKMEVLDPDYAVCTSQQWTEKLSSGKSFFFLDNSGFSLNYTNNLKQTEPDGKFQVLPIMENKYGQRRAFYYETRFTDTIFALSAKIKDPDVVIKFFDWLYTEEGSNITNFGIEGETFELDSSGQPQFKKEYAEKFKDAQPAPYYAIYSDLGITKLNFSLWACNTMTQFQIEKLTGTWNEQYDEYWGIIEADDAYVDPVVNPPLTPEEASSYKDIMASLNTMLEQEYDKFIMGTKDISEYDAVIEKAIEMGALEIEKIYNNARARMLK
jgi:putative aldouronate transport system substrate-binding protein